MKKTVSIKNKRARFEFEILDKYIAGIVLTGTEIKSIRNNKASIVESFCEFNENEELFAVNMYIEEYSFGSQFNHRPRGSRKLLLNKKELKKLNNEIKKSGLTIVPLKLYINDKGFAKMLIALARGKKLYDKRQVKKTKDWNREKARLLSRNNR